MRARPKDRPPARKMERTGGSAAAGPNPPARSGMVPYSMRRELALGALVSAVAWAVFATAALSARGAEQPRAIG
jgi:hypothetical protein